MPFLRTVKTNLRLFFSNIYMSDLLLSLKNITVRNQNQVLFENLSFTLKKGEHWALVGASGSGKSAFLAALAGGFHLSNGLLEHPFFDKYVSERSVSDPLFTWHKLIAQVTSRHHFRNLSHTRDFYYQQRFNSSDSEDAETVEQYLSSVPVLFKGYWDFNKVVTRLKLGPLLDKQLIKLSNGETKRLLIAAALIRNPVLLLLDNPLTGLDVDTRREFNGLLNEVTESGISVIMAASPAEIPDVITHIAVLENGGIAEVIPRKEFSAEKITFNKLPEIDSEELRNLLSLYEQEKYDTVVGMENVVIRYGEKVILDGVNWLVKQGERWALLGHNGAGKSTLLSLINGDNPQAYANKITLFDRKRGSGESIWDIKKKTGFVSPELFQYFPGTTSSLQVIESGFYDTLGLFRPSDPRKAGIARKWMQLLEIEGYAGKLFKSIPASIQRLCLLARALVKNPPLLIFDEPCQGLDPHQQAHFKHVVDSICRDSNVTLIYVTHYQSEIPGSVNRKLRLDQGKVIERI